MINIGFTSNQFLTLKLLSSCAANVQCTFVGIKVVNNTVSGIDWTLDSVMKLLTTN